MAVKTFTSGETLTAADTNNYLNGGGLVYVSESTVGTGVASHAVANCFSSLYDNYRIVYSGGVASGLISLGLSLGASGTQYYSIVNYATYAAATTPLAAGDNNANKWGYVGYASTNYVAMSLDLINPFAAQFTAYGAASWAAVTVAGASSGLHQVSTSYTGFTLHAATGTITGGKVTVYGYRKA